MTKLIRTLALALSVLALAACQEEQAETATESAAPTELVAPAGGDEKAWRDYLMAVVKQNMQGIRNSPYMYYLPQESSDDFEGLYERQLENVQGTLARTVLPGNMLAFGSPASSRMADLVVDGFSFAEDNAFQGVRVLFIGKQADRERVEAAVTPSGSEFVFVPID